MRSRLDMGRRAQGPLVRGNHDSDHKGSLFQPAAGVRSYSIGELANTSSYGYYWSSSLYYGGNSYAGSFGSGPVNPLSSNSHANGFSVRCVRDK